MPLLVIKYKILGFWSAIFLCLVIYLSQSLIVRSDISFFLPDQKNVLDQIMQYQLKEGDASKFIVVVLKNKSDKEIKDKSISQMLLANVNKLLAQRLRQKSEFTEVKNGQLLTSELKLSPFFDYRYLFQLNDENLLAETFSKVALEKSFKQLLSSMQMLLSSTEQQFISSDPLMRWLALLKQWNSKKISKKNGVWFDANNEQSLLFLKTKATGYDLKQQEKNIHIIHSEIQAINNNQQIKSVEGNNDFKLDYILSGAPVFALDSKQIISQQIKYISTAAFIVLMVFLWWVFRSIKVLIVIGFPLAFAALTGLTVVNLIDGYIHGITIAFGITIIGVAIDYPIHLYSHYYFHEKNTSDINQTIKIIWPKLRLGLITTIIGFSAILFSDLSGLRQLGIFAITGLIAAAMLTRYLLPSLISSVPGNHQNEQIVKSLTNQISKWQFLLSQPGPKIITTLIILVSCSLLIINQASLWENDLSAMSPIAPAKKQQDFNLRKAIGIPELRYALIVKSNSLENVLQQSEQLKPVLNTFINDKLISGFDMAANYFPSQQWQSKRQQELQNISNLSSNIIDVINKLGLNENAFAPFIESIENSHLLPMLASEQSLNELPENFISNQLNSLLLSPKEQLNLQHTVTNDWLAIIPLKGVSDKFKDQWSQQDTSSDVRLLDIKLNAQEMIADYRQQAFYWFFIGLFLIILVLIFSGYKLNNMLALVVPFTGAIVLTISTLVLLGYSLSIFHLVCLLLIVGIGIDYSVFMLNSLPDENALEIDVIKVRSAFSVIICVFSTLIMFGALSFSDMPVLNAIGLTAFFGALYAFILTIIYSDP
ncbi:MAG: MMPL family transporter [Gammaproteobacteria bacterium]|nr:MMPL family transporter [Gammaproteobacteria bacterium]